MKEKEEYINGYLVVRKNIKNINIRINKSGELKISAPLRLNSRIIEQFLISKESWMTEAIENRKQILENKKENLYIDGEVHKIIGKDFFLKVIESKIDKIEIDGENLYLYTKKNTKEYKEKLINKWYKEKANIIFSDIIDKWLKILNEKINHLSIKKMTTRWGSCNHKKKYINLNVELVKRSVFEIEYVVLHELSHLKHPHHGKSFYEYVGSYMSNYKEAEKLLKLKTL